MTHDVEPRAARRPRSVVLVAATLVVIGVLSVLAGIAASALSGCCGSREPGSSSPTLYGLAVGVAAAAAGIALWRGAVSRWLVLGPSAAVPVALVVAAPSSSDLGAVAPVAVLGWLLLVWFVRRKAAAAWLAPRVEHGAG